MLKINYWFQFLFCFQKTIIEKKFQQSLEVLNNFGILKTKVPDFGIQNFRIPE